MTAIENARNEWNVARLAWPILDGKGVGADKGAGGKSNTALESMASMPVGQLFRVGLGLTWPIAAVALAALVVFSIALFTRR